MNSEKHSIWSSILLFLKATLLGGLLFLLPLVVVVVILGHALTLASSIIKPVIKYVPVALVGTGIVPLLAILSLLILSLLAGLFARMRAGQKSIQWVEASLLGRLPQYQMFKSMAEGIAQIDNTRGVMPALISIEDGWQLGYQMEVLDNGWVVVFMPQSPTPLSGNFMYLPSDRVRPLEMQMVQAMSIVKQLGMGSSEAMRGVNLEPT